MVFHISVCGLKLLLIDLSRLNGVRDFYRKTRFRATFPVQVCTLFPNCNWSLIVLRLAASRVRTGRLLEATTTTDERVYRTPSGVYQKCLVNTTDVQNILGDGSDRFPVLSCSRS